MILSKVWASKKKALKWIGWELSGARYVWEKISPPPENKPPGYKSPVTITLWVLAAYVALFGVASSRYENRVDIIENRANAIYAQLNTLAYKKSLSRISRVQKMECPKKPVLLKPHTVFKSLFFSDVTYKEINGALRETVEDWKMELSEVNLYKADLARGELFGANLRGAELFGANLVGANLKKANLEGADLKQAILTEANLTEANLKDAFLAGATLDRATLDRADLRRADLRGVDLVGANLKKAILMGADLKKANLEGADLGGVDLMGADLEEANLAGVDLEGANLEGTNLEGTNFAGAYLAGTDLRKALNYDKAKNSDKIIR